MYIKTIKWDGDLTIQYGLQTEELTVTSHEKPAKEFFEALGELKKVYCKSLQIPDDRLGISGLQIKETNDGIQYIPTGFLFIPNTENSIAIKGIPMVVKPAKWFLDNHPNKNPGVLTPYDRTVVLKVVLAALHFIEGAREQQELEFEEKEESENSKKIRSMIAAAEKEIPEYDSVLSYWMSKECGQDPPKPGDQEENLFED